MQWRSAPDGAPHPVNYAERLRGPSPNWAVGAGPDGEGFEGLGEHQQGRSPVVGEERTKVRPYFETAARWSELQRLVNCQHNLTHSPAARTFRSLKSNKLLRIDDLAEVDFPNDL
jgi:hypothetical protein